MTHDVDRSIRCWYVKYSTIVPSFAGKQSPFLLSRPPNIYTYDRTSQTAFPSPFSNEGCICCLYIALRVTSNTNTFPSIRSIWIRPRSMYPRIKVLGRCFPWTMRPLDVASPNQTSLIGTELVTYCEGSLVRDSSSKEHHPRDASSKSFRSGTHLSWGRILGPNPDKILKSFPSCYSQSPLHLCLEISIYSNSRNPLQFYSSVTVHCKG